MDGTPRASPRDLRVSAPEDSHRPLRRQLHGIEPYAGRGHVQLRQFAAALSDAVPAVRGRRIRRRNARPRFCSFSCAGCTLRDRDDLPRLVRVIRRGATKAAIARRRARQARAIVDAKPPVASFSDPARWRSCTTTGRSICCVATHLARPWSPTRWRLRLDPASVDARENLLATLNNWALALFDRGKREQSLTVLQYGLAAAPDHAKLRRNFVAISQQPANPPREITPPSLRPGRP